MTPILLDTGVLVALFDRSERFHSACAAAVVQREGDLITCEPVIAEACYLLRSIPGAPQAVLANVASGSFKLPPRLAEQASAVAALMTRWQDLPMDLADACLVHLAATLPTRRILTLDSDFTVYRIGKTARFELLIDLQAQK